MGLVRANALYRQLANVIRQAIADGEYPPGNMLPSEADLSTRYEVSRPTVRQALAALRTEGLIDVRRGKGSFVRNTAAGPTTALRRHVGTAVDGNEADLLGEFTEAEEPTRYRTTLDTVIGPLLAQADGEAAFGTDRVLTHNATGLRALHRTVIPFATADGTRLADNPHIGGREIYAALRDAGHTLTWHERVTARMPTPDESATLRLREGAPLLVLRRITGSDAGPLLLEELRFGAETAEITYA